MNFFNQECIGLGSLLLLIPEVGSIGYWIECGMGKAFSFGILIIECGLFFGSLDYSEHNEFALSFVIL